MKISKNIGRASRIAQKISVARSAAPTTQPTQGEQPTTDTVQLYPPPPTASAAYRDPQTNVKEIFLAAQEKWFAARPAMEQAHIDHRTVIYRIGKFGPLAAALLHDSGLPPEIMAQIEQMGRSFARVHQALKDSHERVKQAMNDEINARSTMLYREQQLNAITPPNPRRPNR